MRTADLYIRVSTDEQAEKGYSLRSQQEVLLKHCEQHKIKVRQIFIEDYSAKSFLRPEWKKLMVYLRRSKGRSELLLFTKWDRFSRNTSEAYQMISTLTKMGIEPQAIEQPLDLNVPENKMMLAVYLTAPEIENDRRGLNTKAGIRQAKKEGRWMGKAPKGYANKAREDGRRYIAVKEPEASIMQWVFNQLEEGIYSGEHILKAAHGKGLKCEKNNFYHAIRNPVYCGKIRVPAFKDESARLVDGLHEPLISEAQFYKVQDILDGRKKEYGLPIATPDELILRNFLKCPRCHRMLTGSASKGRTTYRVYYHCRSKCGARFRTEEVNSAFLEQLMQFIPRNGYSEIFVQTVTDAYNNQTKELRDDRKELITAINQQTKRMENARELMLNNDITSADYRIIKEQCNEKITRLEAQLNHMTAQNAVILDIKPIAQQAIENLQELDKLYERAGVEGKRYLVGMLYPEKLTYSEGGCRTTKMNEAAELIYLKNKELQAKKMGRKSVLKTSSHKGWNMGLEPTTS